MFILNICLAPRLGLLRSTEENITLCACAVVNTTLGSMSLDPYFLEVFILFLLILYLLGGECKHLFGPS